MAKRFYNTQRIEEDWYLNLSCKHRELLRYCESKCDQAGVFNFNSKIASSYIGEKIDEKDLSELPIKKLDNGRFWIVDFISEQNGELSEKCPAHNPIYKSIRENNLSELLNTLSNTLYNRVQEKEIVIDKEIEMGIDKEKDKEKEKSLHSKFRATFEEIYQRKRELKYIWSAKDGFATKQLISKVSGVVAEADEQSQLEFWRTMIEHLPDWYLTNGFSPSVINSKFNEIISKINKPNGTNNSTVDRQVDEILKRGNPYA